MAVLIAVAGIAAVCVTVIGNGPGHRGARPSAGSGPATTPAPTTRTSSSPTTRSAVESSAAVGLITLTVTGAGGLFPVVVRYPAARAGPGQAPLASRRPFPLIVFSPGFDIDPGAYDALVSRWTSLGFVVAVPDYPFTAAGAPGGVNEADILQHPADLEATIAELLTASSRAGSVLSGMINPSRIGLAGHSDGGDVTDAVMSNSCCRDYRIRAAAILSGAELGSFGGTYGPSGVPVLVVQGDSDAINAPACSEQIYDTVGQPRFYLDLHGAGHLPPYTADPSGAAYQREVDKVTALFWAAYLKGDAAAASTLKAGGGVGPTATLVVGAPVPQLGGCPGAP
jgi:predicted dienelactone hydrolase